MQTTNWTLQDFDAYIRASAPNFIHLDVKDRLYSFSSEKVQGTIQIYEQNIVELSIFDERKKENVFYLHFQLHTAKHARELLQDFYQTLLHVLNAKQLNILLTCTSALTTSFFAKQLNEAAAVIKEDMYFQAVSFTSLFNEAYKYDVILLAPQVASIFAAYKTGELFHLIKQEFSRKTKVTTVEETIPELMEIHDNAYRILVICMINRYHANRCAYRIYDHGKKTLDKEVIKPTLTATDIDDLLTYIFARHRNLDCVGISLPGITEQGSVNNPESARDFHHLNLAKKIVEKHHIPAVILNDANALALGYHMSHEDSDNLVFCFYPEGIRLPGAGVIMHGALYRGLHHNAGELSSLIQYALPEEDLTPEAANRQVVLTILAYISTIAPEKMVIYNQLTPDMEEIRKELLKYTEEQYIPALISVQHIKKYMMRGLMGYCLTQLNRGEDYLTHF